MQILPFDNRDGVIWLNGKFVEWRHANVHVLNHGLHYASCVFEGLRIYNGKIFKLDEHTERLFKSAKILDLNIPYNYQEVIDISKEIFSYIKNLSQKFLKQNIDDCVLTVPAYFDEKARSGIMRAAFSAGFNVRRLINEPTAAAFAYGLEKKKKRSFFSL